MHKLHKFLKRKLISYTTTNWKFWEEVETLVILRKAMTFNRRQSMTGWL